MNERAIRYIERDKWHKNAAFARMHLPPCIQNYSPFPYFICPLIHGKGGRKKDGQDKQ